MAGTMKLSRKVSPLPKELRAFCQRLGITRYVPVALRLLRDCFPKMRDLKMYPECDPESEEEWLVLQIRVPGSYREVDRQYTLFNEKRVQGIPLKHVPSIRLMHIRI